MLSDEEYPCVEYEDVVAGQGILNKDLHTKGVCKNGIKFSSENVLYGKLRPYLHNWLNPDFSGVAVGDWWVLKPINADKNFLFRPRNLMMPLISLQVQKCQELIGN